MADHQEMPKTPSATVILVRSNQDDGFEIYLVRRSAKSGFMAGFYVFPGGTLEDSDQEMAGRIDMAPAELTLRFGDDPNPETLIPYAVAAIRETFEEAGVLIGASEAVSTDSGSNSGRRAAFGRLMRNRDCRLGLSRLWPWAHWITPAGMSRRFDTRYFLAIMPPDQICRPDNFEVSEGAWTTPQTALEKNHTGELPLAPPMVVTCHQLSRFQSVDDLKKRAERLKWGPALAPRLISLKPGAVILEPWDPLFEKPDAGVDREALAGKVLAPGDDFSRIWLNDGLWLPVAV